MYLIRHAEAEGNLYRRAHGQLNSLLTKNGILQTELLGEWFSRRPVDAVYASDLFRAFRTAEAVASACRKPVTTDKDLREIRLGEWEDLTWGEIAKSRPDYMRWFDGESGITVPGAESYIESRERLRGALRRIARKHDGQDVAVVSHGCVLRSLLISLSGGAAVPHLDNASVSCIEWDGDDTRVLGIGENRFLGELSTHAKQAWWRDDPRRAHDAELWFDPARLPEEFPEVLEIRRLAWMAVYGTTEGYAEDRAKRALTESAETHPRYLQFATDRDKRIGLLHMRDGGRLSVTDGHVALFYLNPDKRGKGLGAQLLGEAVSVARSLGKTGLTLRVFHQNTPAINFYRRMGFSLCGSEQGLFGTVLQMRLGIAVPDGQIAANGKQ
ncbi:MAG: GNAT family N-acetyltransferase [Oscillospiraceae bacterium]|jgi:probable phosphoglycerate mutase|nr:GNAT family N-acetyltransferase [Oscillospiraceae bacterium]